ncbi:MAG: IlvD/Edd family dehydratase [Mycobacteriales bacterium]
MTPTDSAIGADTAAAGAGAAGADPARAGRRSAAWFGATGKLGFVHRSKMHAEGLSDAAFDGRPVIGIANSWSELTPCNFHLRELAQAVRRGILMAGGLPLEFPVMSMGETLMRPTTMLYRNMLAMETEETLRSNPLDAVVLLTGCDKTTPGMLMGAASVDLPTILLSGGPMLNGKFRGRDIGSGTHVWKLSEEVRAGHLSECAFRAAEPGIARSRGHCMTMGTASTMACLTEILGMQLPGSAALPAPDTRRETIAELAGRRIVAMADSGPRPSDLLTRKAFENAVRANAALGGSTNAVLHLLALAGRVGVDLTIDDIDTLPRDVPTLIDLLPIGRFLMEEFAYAGGVPALVRVMGGLLHDDVPTVTGRTLGQESADAECFDEEVIRPLASPVQPAGSGIAVLRGNLAPGGAIIKQAAASPALRRHAGRALVFDTYEEYQQVVESPDLPCDRTTVLIVRGAGPVGYPGMPEIGNLAVPARVLREGDDDIVRISDGRMSGTAYGTVVLHVTPESATGGPLALVRTGDEVTLDVAGRSLSMAVPEDELTRRRGEWTAPERASERGWARLYVDHVLQADRGVDLDFLAGGSGHAVPRPSF